MLLATRPKNRKKRTSSDLSALVKQSVITAGWWSEAVLGLICVMAATESFVDLGSQSGLGSVPMLGFALAEFELLQPPLELCCPPGKVS